jgi:hypothetical protein
MIYRFNFNLSEYAPGRNWLGADRHNMNHKFQFNKLNGKVQIDEATSKRRTELISSLPDGDYEIIIRKQVKWDVDKMRKYFHGPVLGFIVEQFKITGNIFGKNEVKMMLKGLFGKSKDVKTGVHTTVVPCSASEYTFADYAKFLKDINAWCIECFQCELPPSNEVE